MTPAELIALLEEPERSWSTTGDGGNIGYLVDGEEILLAAALRLAEAINEVQLVPLGSEFETKAERACSKLNSTLAAYRSERQRLASNAP